METTAGREAQSPNTAAWSDDSPVTAVPRPGMTHGRGDDDRRPLVADRDRGSEHRRTVNTTGELFRTAVPAPLLMVRFEEVKRVAEVAVPPHRLVT